LYLRFSLVYTSFKFNTHHQLKVFASLNNQKTLNFINFESYFSRWLNSHSLIVNSLYYGLKILTIGNSFFAKEILAINWLNFKYTLADFYFLRFSIFFQDQFSKINENHFKVKLSNSKADILFFTDYFKAQKILTFLKNTPAYLIGLSPSFTNPWEFHYPIPAFSTDLVLQYIWLRILFNLVRITNNHKFYSMKLLWQQSLATFPLN
jgi:hypothetical protein